MKRATGRRKEYRDGAWGRAIPTPDFRPASPVAPHDKRHLSRANERQIGSAVLPRRSGGDQSSPRERLEGTHMDKSWFGCGPVSEIKKWCVGERAMSGVPSENPVGARFKNPGLSGPSESHCAPIHRLGRLPAGALPASPDASRAYCVRWEESSPRLRDRIA